MKLLKDEEGKMTIEMTDYEFARIYGLVNAACTHESFQEFLLAGTASLTSRQALKELYEEVGRILDESAANREGAEE